MSGRFGTLGHFQAKFGHDFLKVFPDVRFRGGVAKQISRMVRGHQAAATPLLPLAAKLGDAASRAEKSLRGTGSETDDDVRVQDINLAQKKWRASMHFVVLGPAVVRRAALDHVADIDIRAIQPHRFDHLGEKLAGTADEGQALHIFIGAGAFTNEDQSGLGATVAENELVAALMQLAAGAVADVFANFR